MRMPNPPSLLAAAVIAASVGMSSVSASAAAILDVIGGQLVGARDVLVGDTLYNVQFTEGSCVSAFDGCDAVSDFPFENADGALEAAQALLDQVFLDGPLGLFDTETFTIAGCSSDFLCDAYIPFEVGDGGAFSVRSAFARNHLLETDDSTFTIIGVTPWGPFTEFDTAVLAVFSPARTADVPAPGAFWLFCVGLAGLAIARRRPAFATRQTVLKRT